MGILNWLFSGADDEALPPPPHHRGRLAQRQGSVAAAHQSLSGSDVEELASEHGVSAAAIQYWLVPRRVQSRAAQFSHPELGGMG
jgi:hypothetical protein